jgi:RNA polymerase subunit RPABC4/transcription elongation factor Spt4
MLLLRLIQVLGLGARGFWSWQLAHRSIGRNRKICQEHRQMLTSNWSSVHLIVNAGKTTIRQKSGHCAIAIRSVQIKKRAVKEIIAHIRKDHYGKKEPQSTHPEPVTMKKTVTRK